MSANHPPISRRRLWLWRLTLATLVPLGLLLVLELALRVGGAGFATSFWIPAAEPGQRVTNDDFARQFFTKQIVSRPFFTRLPDAKPAGAIRIFLLGESAAMGTPDPAFGPARLLEIMLRQQYPQRQIEVINTAMRGIDSHVVRRIALDSAGLEPDLFIVYTGNNEGVGLHAPGPDTRMLAMDLRVIRLAEFCKATRLGQLIRQSLAARNAPPVQDMDFFRRFQRSADDPRTLRLRENFSQNLREICAVGRFPKIMATMAVNLMDCPPLGSRHRQGLSGPDLVRWTEACEQGTTAESQRRFADAIAHYQAAAALDAQYAELHYRLGRCFFARGDREQARRHFELARDWDALPFRADGPMNAAVRRVAEEHRGQAVSLCDVETAFAASELSERGIPGNRLFYEHVHPTFAGTYLLARSFYPSVTNALAGQLGAPAGGSLPTVEDCARQLAFTKLDYYNVMAAITRLTANPPFLDQLDHADRQLVREQELQQLRTSLNLGAVQDALATYQDAIRLHPDDWVLRYNLGNIYLQLNRGPDSLEQFAWLTEHYPRQPVFHKTYGSALISQGQTSQALPHLQAALKLAPHDPELRTLVTRAQIK